MLVTRPFLVAGLIALSATAANAYEFGFPGSPTKPGVTIGAPAAAPPVGLYAFDQYFDYSAKSAGAPGGAPGAQVDYLSHGFVWSPGWTFLGAQYSGMLVAHYGYAQIGGPVNLVASGFHNPIISNGLSWKLGDSGFFVRAALGIYMPIGTMHGPSGLNDNGNPWWTFSPNVTVSYLKNGWNLTANIFDEINTENSYTHYRTGDILHAEFTATKEIGKWKIGPVGYYVGQVTNDRSSAYYNYGINSNRYDVWAAGGLIGYDFGPVAVDVWAVQEVSARAYGGNTAESNSVFKGLNVMAQFNYKLWSPGDDAPQKPKYSGFYK